VKHSYGLFSPKLGCTCRVIYDTQISTQYVEEPDNCFVEITKDLLWKMRNIKISDCDEIPIQVAKVFSTVMEGIGLDGGCVKKITECIIGFVIKY
jgi:hypothetical protein